MVIGQNVTIGCESAGKQSGRFIDSDFLHQHAFLTIRQIGLTRARGGILSTKAGKIRFREADDLGPFG